MRALQARDPQAAARSVVLILGVCTVVLIGLTLLTPPPGPMAVVVSWSVVALLVMATALCAFVPAERLDRAGVGLWIALGGTGLICLLNLLTSDSSAAAQAFLAFPVLWAASHLRPGAVMLVTGIAVTGNAASLWVLLPHQLAVTDAVFFGAVLVVMAVMLVRADNVKYRLVAALREQARIDSLTGLVNRRVFDETLEATVRAPGPAGTALVLIDVDAFKSINDSHGHPAGDDVLVHLAGVLRQQVRGTDALLSRLGGDELAVQLTPCTAEAAVQRAEHLLAAVRSAPLELADGTLLALSISLGVAHLPQHSDDILALYSAADAALYEAKRAGRGRVVIATT